jgi:hypothetical protein
VKLYRAEAFAAWGTSVMNRIERAVGRDSVHAQTSKQPTTRPVRRYQQIDHAKGILAAARADCEGGYLFNLEAQISGEMFGDPVVLALGEASQQA